MRARLILIQLMIGLSVLSAGAADCAKVTSFKDQDLEALKKQYAEFVVYIWSPYMPLSAIGRNEIEAAAKDLKIAHVANVLDPSPRLCHEASGPLADPSFNSQELIKARALNHYPTMVYFQKGEIKAVVPGYDDPAKFKNRIEILRQGSKL
jgi:hypothetical protein